MRNQRYRYVEGNALYDMKKDPNQTTNILEDHPTVVAEMRAAYAQFWKEARPLMVNETAKMSPTKPYHVLFNKQKESATGIPAWNPPSL